MIRRYKFRIYPDSAQKEIFEKNFNAVRYVYNWALALRIKNYQEIKASKQVNNTLGPREAQQQLLVDKIKFLKSVGPKRVPYRLLELHWATAILYGWPVEADLKIELCQNPVKSLSAFDIGKLLTQFKKQPEHSWLGEANAISLGTAVQHLDAAYKNFFRRVKTGTESPGFPRFKSKHDHQKSYSFHQNYTINFEAGKIRLPKMSWVKGKFHRIFLYDRKTATAAEVSAGKYAAAIKDKSRIKAPAPLPLEFKCSTLTVIQEPSGKYFVSVVVDDNTTAPMLPPIRVNQMVGLDHGIVNALTLSDGQTFNAELGFEKLNAKLLRLQRALSRKVKGSANFNKNRVRIAKQHEKIRLSRKYAIEQLVVELVAYLRQKHYTTIVIRKYAVHKMVQKIKPVEETVTATSDGQNQEKRYRRNGRSQQKKMNRQLLNASLGMVFQQVKTKCSVNGINVIELDVLAEKTTNKCSFCGEEKHIKANKTTREFECSACGFTDDMDVNAAKNCVILASKDLSALKHKMVPAVQPII